MLSVHMCQTIIVILRRIISELWCVLLHFCCDFWKVNCSGALHFKFISRAAFSLQYDIQGDPLPSGLQLYFVNFDLRVSPCMLPTRHVNSARFPDAKAESGRQRNYKIKVNQIYWYQRSFPFIHSLTRYHGPGPDTESGFLKNEVRFYLRRSQQVNRSSISSLLFSSWKVPNWRP